MKRMLGRFEEPAPEPLPEGAEPPSRFLNPDAYLAVKPHVPTVRFTNPVSAPDGTTSAGGPRPDPLRGPGAYDAQFPGVFGPAPPPDAAVGGGDALPAEWQPFGLAAGRGDREAWERPKGAAEGDRLELEVNLDAVRPAARCAG